MTVDGQSEAPVNETEGRNQRHESTVELMYALECSLCCGGRLAAESE